jgi:hypothetical protein
MVRLDIPGGWLEWVIRRDDVTKLPAERAPHTRRKPLGGEEPV